MAGFADMIFGYGQLAVALYKDQCDVGDAREALEERYQGEFPSLEHWAMQCLEDTGSLRGIPEDFLSYVDFARWGRDAELVGDITAIKVDGKAHVFSDH